MNFNYRAVSKKERIQKTLVLGIPFTLISGIILSFVLSAVRGILNINVIYYIAYLGYGLIVGRFVRKIGKGTTQEFLILAGVYAFVGVCIGEYLSLFGGLIGTMGFMNSLNAYVSSYILALPSAMNGFSLVVKAAVIIIAVSEATIVRTRDF